MEGRYKLYGVVPSEHEIGNSELNPDDQELGGTIQLYATDDPKEADTVLQAGGFMRGEQWCAVTWGKDTLTGKTIGNVPTE